MNDQNRWLTGSLPRQVNAELVRRDSITIGRALILAADETAAVTLPGFIRDSGLQPISMGTMAELRSYRLNFAVSLLLCEERLPDGTFRDALNCLCGVEPRVPMIVFSRIAEWQTYLEAVRCGAYDCLRYPFRAGELQQIVRLILAQERFSASEANLESRHTSSAN